MKLSKYKLILVLIMLWLPLQSVSAVVLSVCMQEKGSDIHHNSIIDSADNHHHDDCQVQATNNNASNNDLASLPCDDVSCHASCGTTILSASSAATLIDSAAPTASLNSAFVSFLPEQLQRPPLA